MAGFFKELKEKITRYLEVNINLFKIELIDSSSRILSYVILSFASLLVLMCIVLFFGYGLAEVFIDAGFSRSASFFLTSGIYSFLLIMIVVLRRPIVRYIASAFVNIITGDRDSKEDVEKNDN